MFFYSDPHCKLKIRGYFLFGYHIRAHLMLTKSLAILIPGRLVTLFSLFDMFIQNFDEHTSQISNGGRYSIDNINQQLTICQQMLKTWCNDLFLFWIVVKKLGAFVVYTLSYNLADLNWAKEQSTSIRYLWKTYSDFSSWLTVVQAS